MKGLASLTNIQRAKVLYELFPAEIADFITFEAEVALKIVQDKS